MTDNWNLQTNVKNKPNAQGTLFSGGKSQMKPEKRYKKGYTPERQAAVRENLRNSVADYVTPEYKLPNYESHLGPHALRTLEQIKQSTIPPEHLKGLHVNVVDREDEDGPHPHGLTEDTLGEYQRHGNGYGEVNVGDDAGPYTLLHEIGHHASASARTPHSAYNSPHQRGREEGFADAYADQHMTPKLSKQRGFSRGKENYGAQDWQTEGRATEFHAGYDNMRPYDARPMNRDDVRDARVAQKSAQTKNNPTLPGL